MTSVPRRHDPPPEGLSANVLLLVTVAVLIVAIPIALLVLFLSDEKAEQAEHEDTI